MANPFAVAAGLMLEKRASVYTGANFNRLNLDWNMSRLSANQALRFDAQTLRNRARDLCNNNSTAASIPSLFAENVSGKDGIRLQSRIETTRGKLNKSLNEQIEDEWEEWCQRGNCTVDGRMSFADFQRLMDESECRDGELLVHMVRGFQNPWGFALDLIDPDQLDIYLTVPPSSGRNMIFMGVEMDPWWRPMRYHIWTNHPSDPLPKRRITAEASEIQHVFLSRRPRQARGVTWFAPVVMDLKMLGGYREAELVAARAASAKMGFLVSKEDGTPMLPNPGDASEEIEMTAEPGAIEQLPPGVEFQGWNPEHPVAAFDAFDKAILRSVATALRLSYMSVSGDLRGTSYGSGRIGMLAERAVFETLQERKIENVLDPIYRAWFRMSCMAGRLDVPAHLVTDYMRMRQWHPRTFPWIDPRNDIEAVQREVAMGVQSLSRIAAQKGRDFEEVMADRQREMKLAREYGVPLVLERGTPVGGPSFDSTDPNALTPEDEAARGGQGGPGTDPDAPAEEREAPDPDQLDEGKPRRAVRLVAGGVS